MEAAVALVTKNVARVLKLGHKGRVAVNADADLLLTDERLQIVHVFAKGVQMVRDGKAIVFGTFEHTEQIPGAPAGQATAGKENEQRGRRMLSPDSDDPDDFPDEWERQKRSRRFYCC